MALCAHSAAAAGATSRGCGLVARASAATAGGWDVSRVTDVLARTRRLLGPPPIPLLTHTRCASLLTLHAPFAISLCRVQATYAQKRAAVANQPLEPEQRARFCLPCLTIPSEKRRAPPPLRLSTRRMRRTSAVHLSFSLLLTIHFAECLGYLPRRRKPSTSPPGVERLEGHYLIRTRRLSSSLHPSPPDTHAVPRFCLPSLLAECRLPSETRLPSTNPSRHGMSRGSRPLRTRRLSSSPPIPSDTHALCLAFAYHSLCRVQGTFDSASAFNQPLEAWNVSRVTNLAVRAASLLSTHPL